MINIFLANMISFYILTLLGASLFKYRIENQVVRIILYFSMVIINTFLNGVSITILTTTILTIFYIVYIVILFRITLKKFAIMFFFYISSSAVSEVLSANLMNFFSDLRSGEINSWKYTFAVLLSGVITYFMTKIFIKMLNNSDLNFLPKYTYAIFILPITTMALILNIGEYFILFKSNKILLIILIGLIASNFITIFIFLKFAETSKLETELLNTKKEKELSDIKYEVLNNQFTSNYYFLHDTIRELNKILNINQSDDDLKMQLLYLNTKLIKGLNVINSNSSILSPILNYKLNEIIDNKIDFKNVIEYNDFTFIDIYVQRELFTLLLDIAIHQCKKVNYDKRLAILKTKKMGKQIIIQLITVHYSFDEIITHILNQLNKLVKNSNGIVSYESDFNQNYDDSFLIVFTC